MAYDDEDLDALLRRMPAPGVPRQARERHLVQLRAAIEAEHGRPAQAQAHRPSPGGHPLRRRDRTGRPTSRRRRVTIALISAGAVVVTASAAATIVYERAQDRSRVHCYPVWTTDFDNPRLGGDAMQVDADSAAGALGICSSLWRQGFIVSTPPYTGDGTQGSDPRLIACVLPDGVVGIFPPTKEPGQQTCQDLGLAVSDG